MGKVQTQFNTLNTKIDSISFINYTSSTLHYELDNYCNINNLSKHTIETNTAMNKYLIKKDNKVMFVYKTLKSKFKDEVLNIIDFNGLLTHSEVDRQRELLIPSLIEYLSIKANLNTWDIRQLDICSDMNITNDKVIVNKKKIKGNRLDKLDTKIGTKTQYIETVKKKDNKLDRTNMLVSSYVYNKTYKELTQNNNILNEDITRFEIKLLPRVFKRIANISDIKDLVDNYTINTYKSKNQCNKDKVLLNANKKVLDTKAVTSKLDLTGVDTFLTKIEKYISLQLVQVQDSKFCIDEF